jgi:predicted DNA-binding ArsR family transcriptional regulator
LGVTAENKNLNDAYEIYLSAKNISSKINAEEAFRKANSEYVNIISTWNENLSGEEVETYFLKLQNLIDENVALFNYMTDTLNNSITSTSFPDSSLT